MLSVKTILNQCIAKNVWFMNLKDKLSKKQQKNKNPKNTTECNLYTQFSANLAIFLLTEKEKVCLRV